MAAETSKYKIELGANSETFAEGLFSCIHEYQLLSLSLEYERHDDRKTHTASFKFRLSGRDKSGSSLTLLHLKELPHDWPSFIYQLESTSAEAGIPLLNQFEADGYEIHCQTIQRRIWRQK